MIAFAIFLFALMVVAWLFAPTSGKPEPAIEREPAGAQPEGQIA